VQGEVFPYNYVVLHIDTATETASTQTVCVLMVGTFALFQKTLDYLNRSIALRDLVVTSCISKLDSQINSQIKVGVTIGA